MAVLDARLLDSLAVDAKAVLPDGVLCESYGIAVGNDLKAVAESAAKTFPDATIAVGDRSVLIFHPKA